MPEPHLNIPIVPIDDEIDLSSFDKNCYFIGSQYSLISDLAPDVFESIMFSIGDVIKNPTFFIPHPRSTDNEISKYLKSENLKLLKLHDEYLDQYFLRNKIYPKVIFSFFSTGPILLSKKYPKCNFVLFDIRKYLLKQSIINDNYINYVKSQNNFLVVEI